MTGRRHVAEGCPRFLVWPRREFTVSEETAKAESLYSKARVKTRHFSLRRLPRAHAGTASSSDPLRAQVYPCRLLLRPPRPAAGPNPRPRSLVYRYVLRYQTVLVGAAVGVTPREPRSCRCRRWARACGARA
jgi:hypothetical protein